MSLKILNNKAKQYTISQEDIEKSEAGRKSFISKFPIESLKGLTIDQYVQGTDENSFCYWLEFKKILFGIGGGNASKFGLYKTHSDGSPLYVKGFGKNKITIEGEELNSYFKELKGGIIKALGYVESGQIEKIKDLDLSLWNMVIQKILSIYYPDKFFTIGAPHVLIECARDIKIEGVDLDHSNSIQINFECKKALSELVEYEDWSYVKFGSFIWETYEKESNRDFYIIGSKYGENADIDVFPKMIDKSAISIGFAKQLNLEEYCLSNHKKIIDYLKENGEDSSSYSALKYFLNLKVGDIIAIKADGSPKGKKGFLSIVGLAEVVKKDGEIYRYEPDGLGHLVNVRFIDAPVYKEFDLGGYGRTVHKITKREHIDLIFKSDYEVIDIEEKTAPQMNYPLNTIFYGPPGTGKTYNTVHRAAEIIENKKIESYSEALKIFQENLHSKIEFITFHQNYSYEDFIQGLRPDTENDKDLTFHLKDGVLKIIADKALKNIREAENPESAKSDFDVVFRKFMMPMVEGELDEIEVKMKKTSFFVTQISNKSIEFRKNQGDSQHTLSINTLRKMYDRGGNDIIMGGLQPYYNPILKTLLEIGISNNNNVQRKNYVIVIDEINRANISRVFGELITLIEPDKRSHGAIPMEARLPSGEPFVVPSNLYIIGTMNTADKSIALLDIALRRRFEFEALYPQYEIDGQNIYDVEILKKINKQIIKSKGHDFQIGHAYFMGENKDLVQRMNNKVIPLLMEYYMNDEKEVKGILSNAGLKMEENSFPLRITGKNE